MHALFIPEGESFSIELIPDTQEETDALSMYWDFEKMSVSCEIWRELAVRTNPNGPD